MILVCKVNSYKIAVVENKIVLILTKIWVNDIKKVLIKDLPNRLGNIDNNINNFSIWLISWLIYNTNLVIDNEIIKIFTKIRIYNSEKFLIGALFDKIEDVDNIATG